MALIKIQKVIEFLCKEIHASFKVENRTKQRRDFSSESKFKLFFRLLYCFSYFQFQYYHLLFRDYGKQDSGVRN